MRSVGLLDLQCYPWLSQHFWLAKTWLYIPHDCYFHMFSKEDIYTCGGRDKVDWIHAMGDSQEREFVSMMKMVNGSTDTYTKYQAVSVRVCALVIIHWQEISLL